MKDSKGKKWFLYLVLGFMGAITGTLVGNILGDKFAFLDFLKETYSLGFSNPIYLDLGVIKLTFAFVFDVNIMTILGIILIIILYRKL